MPIYSEYADDPSMREHIEYFLGILRTRCAEMQHAMANGDLGAVEVLAHKVKGAGGMYGFGEVSTSAAELEMAAKSGSVSATEAALGRFVHLAHDCQAGGRP